MGWGAGRGWERIPGREMPRDEQQPGEVPTLEGESGRRLREKGRVGGCGVGRGGEDPTPHPCRLLGHGAELGFCGDYSF